MKVIHINRKRREPGSIEILFTTIRKYFPDTIKVRLFMPRYQSRGLFKRLYIIFESYFNQGDINHITGDIHFSSFLLNKNKTLLTVHDCVSVAHSTGIKRAILKLVWFTLPLKRVRYVTVISEKTKEELLSLVSFPEDHVFVIPDCVSDTFQYAKVIKFNTKNPRILQIGTKTNKNIIRICQALKGLPCTLDIVGKLTKEQLEALKINNIMYVNSVGISEKALIKKYIDADIIAFVSTYEGFGMPIVEAQTIGRPVLTSSIAPMPEVAGEEGACFVDPYDIGQIRKGFEKLIENEEFRNKIVKNGLKNVLNYKPNTVAQMYLELYKKMKV